MMPRYTRWIGVDAQLLVDELGDVRHRQLGGGVRRDRWPREPRRGRCD